MAEQIPYEIKNSTFVIKQIQALHAADPLNAFKEYTTNAIDAFTEARLHSSPVANAQIGIIVNKEEGAITIQDNALGMGYDFLRSIPASIGESCKRGVEEMRGEKAFGMLAYCGFGDRANVLSRRSEDNGRYNYLHMEREKMSAEADRLEARIVKESMKPAFKQGTRITISGIARKTIEDYFTPAKLQHALAEMYDPVLRAGEVKIAVGWYGRNEKLQSITPLKRKGKRVVDDIAETPEPIRKQHDGTTLPGELEVELWVNPDGKEKIGFYNKGVMALDSITKLKEFDKAPWNTGKIGGYINENFCKLVPSRDGVERNNKRFDYLMQMLKEYEPELTRIAEQAENESIRQRGNKVLQEVSKKFHAVYSNKPNPFTKGTGKQLENPRKPPTPSDNPRPPRRAPYVFDMVEFDAHESNIRSKLEDDVMVLLNSSHRDFKRYASSKDREAQMYYAGVISKEVAWADFLAGKRAQDQETGRQFTMNADTLRAIQERATELYLGMLACFGIIKKQNGKSEEQ